MKRLRFLVPALFASGVSGWAFESGEPYFGLLMLLIGVAAIVAMFTSN